MTSHWQQRKAEIRKISSEQAERIIDTRLPLGLFYVRRAGVYIGIDNSNGHAWTEEFVNLRQCKRWLLNPSVQAPVFEEAS